MNNSLVYKEKQALALIAEEEAKTGKLAQARATEMRRIYANRATDTCGWFGRLVEVASHTNRSRQVKVARQGKVDTRVRLEVNGKVRSVPAESKTNGGRIGSLYEAGAPRFVVYTMNLCNAGTGNLPRRLAPVVVLREEFLSLLEECNAIKSTNGTNPEPAIQASSKRLYLALQNATPFEANRVYTLEEISLGK